MQEHGFQSLVVQAVIPETKDAATIILAMPSDGALPSFSYLAGQFLTLRMVIDGQSITRCYSMSSSPDAEDSLHITVKRVSGGLASNWLLDNIRPGSTIFVRPPGGNFILTKETRPLLMFAGGSGITPIFGLVKSALARGWPLIRLFYASREANAEIFGAALSELADRYPSRLEIVRHHDAIHGYPTPRILEEFIGSSNEAAAYLCGPSSFMAACEAALRSAGISDDCIHAEHFVAPMDVIAPSSLMPDGYFSVEWAGKTLNVPYRKEQALLTAAIAQKLPVSWSCMQGQCGACIAQLVDGTVEMPPTDLLSEGELRDGLLLMCQARATGNGCRIRLSA